MTETTGKRLALIIASYEYQDDSLQQLVAPAQDAEALARVLNDTAIGDFETKVLINRLSHEVRFEIESFFTKRKRTDLLLLYFSGHGVKDDDGRLYLTTTDTRRGLFLSTAVPAAFINQAMTNSRSRRQVLILDCCHSGAFARGMVAKGGESVDIRDRFEGQGRVVLTASNATQYAFQGDEIIGEGTHSVFTHHLVQGLETGEADLDSDGWISLDELYDYVYARVTDEMSKQTPGKWTFDLQGDILIARNPHPVVKPVVKPAELPSELRQAVESPLAGLRGGAVSELERLLQGSDEELALVAREALTQLADDDSRTVSAAAIAALGMASARVQGLSNDALPGPAPQVTPEKSKSTSPQRETEQYKVLGPDRIIWKQDGKEMVRVPAGKFLYSDDKKERGLPEFWIDKTLVTNAEYARFVVATDHKPPRHWKGKTPPETITNHPVVNVSWHDAVAYAEWAGKRLPTQEEWEKAARGTNGREYPWGDWWENGRCNTKESGINNTTPVGKYSPDGDSPYGCADMAGNVWDWTASGGLPAVCFVAVLLAALKRTPALCVATDTFRAIAAIALDFAASPLSLCPDLWLLVPGFCKF